MAEQNEGPKPEVTATVTNPDGRVVSAEKAFSPINQYRNPMNAGGETGSTAAAIPSSLEELANGVTSKDSQPYLTGEGPNDKKLRTNTEAWRKPMNGPKDES